MWKEKNINVYLGTEIIFLIITSLIVFTSQPLNWIVAILMFLHLIGIAWLVGNPNSFYRIAEESINLNQATVENGVVLMFLIYAGLALFSRIVF
jgi:surface polysaccharide O-acyltransferase-like enzyme